MNRLITITFLLGIFNYSFSQEKKEIKPDFNIIFSTGFSQVALKDKTISSEKYDGSLNPISIVFQKERENYNWRLNLNYADGLPSNYNIDAEIKNFIIGWDYSYRIKTFEILGNHSANLFSGFSPNLFVHYRKQNIAEPGQFLYSAKLLFNMSVNVGVYGVLTNKLSYHLITRFNLFTYGMGVASEEGDSHIVSQSSVGFSAPIIQSILSIKYELIKGLKLGLTYDFNYVKHDKLSMSSDAVLISFTKKIGK